MTNYCLDLHQEITFNAQQTKNNSPLTIECVQIEIASEHVVEEVRLQLKTDLKQYEKIEDRGQFNLASRWRGTMTGKFIPDEDIMLEVMLQPDRIPDELSNDILDDLSLIFNPELLQTELWLGLSVYQQQEKTKVGYQTFWKKANLTELNQAVKMGTDAIEHLFDIWQQEADEILSEAEIEGKLSGLVRQLERWSEEEEEQTISIESVVRDFFNQEDLEFVQIEEGLLQVTFQGENGRWRCYGRMKEENQQFLFYSICPLQVPEECLSTIAEFLTKANYGIILGNFELDLTDGEIRYKTSIDVEGDRLSVALVRQLVYANAVMMDRYLPGIVAIIEEDASADEAIARVEE